MKTRDWSITIEGRFVHEYGLKDHALLVYSLLREITIREGGFIESTQQLADMAGIHPTTVRTIVRSLEIGGFASTEKILDGDRRVVKIVRITRL